MMKFIPGSISELTRYLPFPLPILSGPGKGLWWKNTPQTLNGYWMGSYEIPVQRALSRLLRPGDTFWDLGAQSGFFSLLDCCMVGQAGKVYSLEPHPKNGQTLRQQRHLNHCTQWELLEAALWNHDNGILLQESNAFTSQAAEFSDMQEKKTSSVRLQTLTETWHPPSVIKVDIEGAESTAFRSVPTGLLPNSTAYIIEIHGSDCKAVMEDYALKNCLQWHDLELSPISSPPEWGQCLMLPESNSNR